MKRDPWGDVRCSGYNLDGSDCTRRHRADGRHTRWQRIRDWWRR